MKTTVSRKDAAVSFLRQVVAGRIREAYKEFIDPDFWHHNPYFRGDRKSLMAAMEENQGAYPDKILEVERVLEDGDLVAVHSHICMNSDDRGRSVVHICRFEGDKIVEMWDIGQEIPADSPNENGAF